MRGNKSERTQSRIFLMEPQAHIDHFLRQVCKKRTALLALRGICLFIAILTGVSLAVNLLAYFLPQTRDLADHALVPALLLLAVALYYCFVWKKPFGFSPYQAARLTEEKYPQLRKNSLINSYQLGSQLKTPDADRKTSLSLIREQLYRSHIEIEKINPADVVDTTALVASRRLLIGVLSLWLVLSLVLPDFLTRGYDNWFQPVQVAQSVSQESTDPSADKLKPEVNYFIQELALTFNFPAYTRLEPRPVSPSDGKVDVLPGTEVELSATPNIPVSGAELVLNGKDHFAMKMTESGVLKSRFIAREKGFYQFQVKDQSGEKHLLPPQYPITLNPDGSPIIALLLANPKPVYYESDKIQFFYEGHDDFGITRIDLVAHTHGKTVTQEVKRLKNGEKEFKGDYTWDLGQMDFQPGDEVQYYLEIHDNDNVLGPNTGQSETFTFTLFDSKKEQEDLILLQEALMEKMIALLGNNLVKTAALTDAPSDPMSWRPLFAGNVDALIELVQLAQKIRERASAIDSFPQPYLDFMRNITTSLTRIREEQIDEMQQIQDTEHKPTQAGYSVKHAAATNGNLIANLEQNILFLVKMTNRQKMDQVMDMQKELSELTESLREEFEKLKDKKSAPNRKELMNQIQKMQDTLNKIMDQIARQTQMLPDEFLNSNAFKNLSIDQFNASMEKLMDLVKQNKIDEALAELSKITEDMRTLANQLDQERQKMDDIMDMELVKKLDESTRKLEGIEQAQKDLIDKTTRLNQSLRSRQSENFEGQLEDFFKLLRKDVNDIQGVLNADHEYLNTHPVMKQMEDLLNQESKIDQTIQELGQKTVDSNLSAQLEENFRALNRARRELSHVAQEMDSLRIGELQKFKESMPSLFEKYNSLDELAGLADLDEFNDVFKQTYPEVFRLQNNLRTTRNRREDLAERVDTDLQEVTRLNSEISKKLGSMMRTLRENFQSLLNEKDKSDIQKMAREQSQTRKDSEDLAKQFSEMMSKNPMLPPDLSAKMTDAGQHMKQAENELKSHDVPGGVQSENGALRQIQETRELLQELKNSSGQSKNKGQQAPLKLGAGSARDPRRGGSVRMQKEKVQLPEENQYKVPTEFREEILNAMKKQTPKSYERMVSEYYKELVK